MKDKLAETVYSRKPENDFIYLFIFLNLILAKPPVIKPLLFNSYPVLVYLKVSKLTTSRYPRSNN